LLDESFETDGINLFVRDDHAVINLSQRGSENFGNLSPEQDFDFGDRWAIQRSRFDC
jgi:hypothetical protein